MIWFLRNSVLSIILIAGFLWIGYGLLKRFKGVEATQEILSSNFVRFLIVILSITIFRLVFGIYGFIAAWLFLTTCSIIWLGSWPLRRLSAGKILSDTRKQSLFKSIIWTNLFLLGVMGTWLIPSLWSGVWLASKTLPKGYLVNPIGLSIILFMVPLFFLTPYLSIFEGPTFRANGICYQYKFIPWDKVTSYSFNALSQGVLIVHWQPTMPIYSRQERIPITSEQVKLVNNILGERLESKENILQ